MASASSAMSAPGAAIANAIYHATGKRIRHLPIRLEDLPDVA
jgi:xanthine dehydrogenase YagR molybdenum-binding subunit